MIYFVLSEYQNAVKIGYVEDTDTPKETIIKLRSRVSSIQTGNPQLLTVVGLTDGNYTEEQALHTQFKDIRLIGEWFTYTEELKSFISHKTNKDYLSQYNLPKEVRTPDVEWRGSFRDNVLKLKELYEPNTVNTDEEVVKIFNYYPWLQYIIDIYGYSIITKQNYVISRLKPLYEVTQSKTDINKEIYKVFKEGQFLLSKDIKDKLSRIYNKLNITKTPMPKDLERYFLIKNTNKWIQGKSVKGYLLLKSLHTVN